MSTHLRGIALLLAVVLIPACSTNGSTGGPTRRSDTITQEDIRTVNQTSLYDVIRAMRPNWLVVRSPNSFQATPRVQVYFDDVRIGGVDELRSLSTQGVQYIRWYDPISASARWGLDHEQGAIVVSTQD